MSEQGESPLHAGQPFSPSRAEQHLRSLELFGMRFGLDRMRRMMTVLGAPQQSFRAIHVLGTNGKSSTVRMTAAILARHGLRVGAYLSPHLTSYTERIQVQEQHITESEFAAAIGRAAWAAERVNRTLAEEDHVTQFELLTAAGYWELHRQQVDVAVIEAGLGGRYDATSVIDAPITVLTNVGLEHTRILGPTITDIACEKLAVLADGATLIISSNLDPEALAVAHSSVRERDARLIIADPQAAQPPLAAAGAFQHANFALACAAAETHLRDSGIEPQADLFAAAAAQTIVPGRLQTIARDPLTVIDGAHNPDAVRALVHSLGQLPGHRPDRPLALVLGVLDDKDAARMLAQLGPLTTRAWFTAPPSPRALSPATLCSLARQLGYSDPQCDPIPARALQNAQQWAAQQAPDAMVLVSGSIYLIGDLLAGARQTDTQTQHSES